MGTTGRVAHTPLATDDPGGTLVEMTGVGVLTVHHDEAVRRAVRAVVNAADGLDGVGEAASAEEALELAVALRPSLALVGTQMPGIDGFETSERLLASVPGSAVVLLYESTEPNGDLLARSGAAATIRTQDLTPGFLRGIWEELRSQ